MPRNKEKGIVKMRLFFSFVYEEITYRIVDCRLLNEMLNAQRGCGSSVKNDRVKLS